MKTLFTLLLILTACSSYGQRVIDFNDMLYAVSQPDPQLDSRMYSKGLSFINRYELKKKNPPSTQTIYGRRSRDIFQTVRFSYLSFQDTIYAATIQLYNAIAFSELREQVKSKGFLLRNVVEQGNVSVSSYDLKDSMSVVIEVTYLKPKLTLFSLQLIGKNRTDQVKAMKAHYLQEHPN